MIIKICGVKDVSTAIGALNVGAHWIGMIFYTQSKRCVDWVTAREMVKAILCRGGTPVGVFLNASASEIQATCETAGIRTIQLHGVQSIKASILLPEDYQRIYALSPDEHPKMILDGCPERDFLLFDACEPGRGIPFDWANFDYRGAYRWFLAGGLTVGNVHKGIQTLRPFGVDVSSSVENGKGEKVIEKIEAFVRATIL